MSTKQDTTLYTLTGKKIGVVTNMYPEQYTLTGKKINPTYGHSNVHPERDDTNVYPVYSEQYTLTGKKIGP